VGREVGTPDGDGDGRGESVGTVDGRADGNNDAVGNDVEGVVVGDGDG